MKSTLTAVQYPHVKRFVHDATRAFGQDSTFARVAKVWEQRWNIMLRSQGMDQVLTSFYASSQGKLKLRSDEMKLLGWAKGSTV